MDSFDMRSLRQARHEAQFAVIELEEIALRHRGTHRFKDHDKMPLSDLAFIIEQKDKLKVIVSNLTNIIEGNKQ